jgi:hypothetical protein
MLKKMITGALVLLLSGAAFADDTITFESVSGASSGSNNGGVIVSSALDGLTWSSTTAARVYLWSATRAASQISISSTTFATYFGSWSASLYGDSSVPLTNVSFAAASGQVIDLVSTTFYSKSAATLYISGYDSLGNLVASQTLSLAAATVYQYSDSSDIFSTAAGISKITFATQTSSAKVLFDNIDINITAAVPEPSTSAMLLMGLGFIGFVARRRMV